MKALRLLLLTTPFMLAACGAGTAHDTSDAEEDVIIEENGIYFDSRDLAIINESPADKEAYERWLRDEIGDENPPVRY